MNPEATDILNSILAKDPGSLTVDERNFLRARSGYLKKSQLEEYKEIVETAPESDQLPEETAEVVAYEDLVKRAKELGYIGKRLKRGQLEEFIKDQETQKNPFN